MNTLSLEYAKTSRSKCKNCKQNIEKNQIRIGTKIKMQGHNSIQWKHIFCFNPARKFKNIDPYCINGFSNLE